MFCKSTVLLFFIPKYASKVAAGKPSAYSNMQVDKIDFPCDNI